MTADQNGWQDCSEAEREALDVWEQSEAGRRVRYEWRVSFWHQGIGWLQHCAHNSREAALAAVDVLRRFWADDLGLARLERVRILTIETPINREEV